MRTSFITLLAATAATVAAQSDNYLVTRGEEFGDALVNLYIRDISTGAMAGHSNAQIASQILPLIKHDPKLLARYAEADPNFKSFMKKVGHGLKKVGKFALKGVSKVMDVAQKVAPMASMIVRDTEWVDQYGNPLEVRDFEDQFEARDYDDEQFEVREYDDQFEIRDVDEEMIQLAARNAEIINTYSNQFEVRDEDEELLQLAARNAELINAYGNQFEARDIEDEASQLAARDALAIEMDDEQFEVRDFDEDVYARDFYEEYLW